MACLSESKKASMIEAKWGKGETIVDELREEGGEENL